MCSHVFTQIVTPPPHPTIPTSSGTQQNRMPVSSTSSCESHMHNFLYAGREWCGAMISSPVELRLSYQFKGLLPEVFCHCGGWVRHFTHPTSQSCSSQCIFLFFISPSILITCTSSTSPNQAVLKTSLSAVQRSFITAPSLFFSLSVCEFVCFYQPLYMAFNTVSLLLLIFQKLAFIW